jgi:hypothetical protein
MKTPLFGITLSVLLCATVRAELKWEQTSLELHPGVGDKQAIGHFKYQNVGKTPVRFKSVKTSCGCTAAQSQKEEVPAGEKGEITATFNIGDRTGTQVKTVTVQTDDPDQAHANTILTLKAVLPEMLTINPTFVFWKGGDDPLEKTITVKAGKDFPAKNLKVTTSNPEFVAKVDSGSNSGEWKISVRPNETTRPIAGVLTIQPELPGAPSRAFYANVSVTATAPVAPPPATAATSPKR